MLWSLKEFVPDMPRNARFVGTPQQRQHLASGERTRWIKTASELYCSFFQFHLEGLLYEPDGFLAGHRLGSFHIRKLAVQLIHLSSRMLFGYVIGCLTACCAEPLPGI
jgi:hypothetical protein